MSTDPKIQEVFNTLLQALIDASKVGNQVLYNLALQQFQAFMDSHSIVADESEEEPEPQFLQKDEPKTPEVPKRNSRPHKVYRDATGDVIPVRS